MSSAVQRAPREATGLPPEPDDGAGAISVAPFFRLLGRYHRVLLLGCAGLVLAWFSGVALARFALPGVTTSTLGIRFTFQGVANGQYPNGLRFSPNDLIAPEVLEQVYQDNELGGVVPFERFRKSIFLVQSNRALDQLESEYAIKLRDSRISTPERRQLEKEFLAAAEGLRTDSYLITYRASGGAVLPPGLDEHVLASIPATWARLAAEKRGVLSYDVDIPSAAPLGEPDGSVDGALRTGEVLRLTSANLRAAGARMERLPGARLVRGERGETLVDLTTEIEVFDTTTVLPVYLMAIRAAGARNPSELDKLLAFRLEGAKRAHAVAEGRAVDLEQALHSFLAGAVAPQPSQHGVADGATDDAARARAAGVSGSNVIAQVGSGFLDEILRARDAAQDAKYRQDLNDKIVKAKEVAGALAADVRAAEYALEQSRQVAADAPVPEPAEFVARARNAADGLRGFATRLRVLFERISQLNLNPESELFIADRPFSTQRTATIGLGRAALGGFGFVTLGMLALVAGCAIVDRRGRHQRD